jgi:hypothetical protein
MANIQTSGVDTKLAPVSLGLSRDKFVNHGKDHSCVTAEAILVQQWVPQLDPLTTITMVVDVTTETKERSLIVYCS